MSVRRGSENFERMIDEKSGRVIVRLLQYR